MHDTTAVRINVANDPGASPAVPTTDRDAGKAGSLRLVRQAHDRSPPPSDGTAQPAMRRGTSRSWLPGSWGDPF